MLSNTLMPLIVAIYVLLAFIPFSSGAPISNEVASELHSHSPPSKINFVNPNALQHPIKEVVYPGGHTIYYGYQNGNYRELPTSLELDLPDGHDTLVLSGAPNTLYLVSSKSHVQYPVKYSISNGQLDLYIIFDGIFFKLPTGGPLPHTDSKGSDVGPNSPMPISSSSDSDGEISNDVHSEMLKSQPPQTIQFVRVRPGTMKGVIKRRTYPNGQIIYCVLQKGVCRALPQSFRRNTAHGPENMVLGGTASDLILIDSEHRRKYPLKYALHDGQLEVYVKFDKKYIHVPISGGPAVDLKPGSSS